MYILSRNGRKWHAQYGYPFTRSKCNRTVPNRTVRHGTVRFCACSHGNFKRAVPYRTVPCSARFHVLCERSIVNQGELHLQNKQLMGRARVIKPPKTLNPLLDITYRLTHGFRRYVYREYTRGAYQYHTMAESEGSIDKHRGYFPVCLLKPWVNLFVVRATPIGLPSCFAS